MNTDKTLNSKQNIEKSIADKEPRHVYIIGAKSIGLYGGFESFVLNLLKQFEDNDSIKFHIACKANGEGCMDLDKVEGAKRLGETEFTYCNAHGFLIKVPEKLGSAQAIYYDINALKWVCNHIERNRIEKPIVYILASRIGLFEKKYAKRIHAVGGQLFHNPDGHENWRRKWSRPVRCYWKLSERFAVKYADMVICDSKNIESYIKDEYKRYNPNTRYIAYGSYVTPSTLADDDPKFTGWLAEHGLRKNEYYLSVGRFVPENNYDIMIREFMSSNTKKDYAIITSENPKYEAELQKKYNFKSDKRIKFVGTVYDAELLKKIRENAYGYIHGHEVGGTNPSLLESLGSTKLNLLLDVGFNREVAEEAALYWGKEEEDLAEVINIADDISEKTIDNYEAIAIERVNRIFSWNEVARKYEEEFSQNLI